MEAIATGIKKKMAQISSNEDGKWLQHSKERLINLQLVRTERKEGFGAHHLKDKKKKKRTPISYIDIFKNDNGIVVDRVIVEGNAGIGKTTLCTIFNKGWAENKMFQNFECIFLLPLRDIEVSSATKLEEIVQLFHTSEEICALAVNELKTNQGEPVLIIADGWDELDTYSQSEESFLYKFLVEGKILPLATVLITSRSSASAPLHCYQFRFIEVVGFNEENTWQYIESEFEEYPEKASSLIDQLKSSTFLQSICSVPLNCALICHMWHSLNQTLPNTMTKLYSLLIRHFILHNLKKKFQEYSGIKSIENFDNIQEDLKKKFFYTCQFAYECLLRDKIVLSQQDVTKHFPEVSIQDPRDEIFCFGLLQSAESLLPNGQGLSFHFAHLTVQEFLAAFHFATQSRKFKLNVCKVQANNDRLEIMWQFVFGLCNNDGNYSESIKPLDDEFLDSFFVCADELLLCHCSVELDEKTFSTKVACKINGDLRVGAHDLLGCNAVFHILRHSPPCKRVTISLIGCGMSDKQLIELADVLTSADSELNVKFLHLDDNKITSEGMSNLFNRAMISLFFLESISIDSNKIMTLSLHPCIEQLSASNNPLGIVGMQSLNRFVEEGRFRFLESLSLENVFAKDFIEVGPDLCTFLSNISENCRDLTELNFSKNTFDENGLFALGKALPFLCNNREFFNLDISDSNIGSRAAVAFSRGIRCITRRVKNLGKCSITLTGNLIGYSGLLAILRALRSKNCSISNIGFDDTKLCCTKQDIIAAKDLVPIIELPVTHSTLTSLYLNNSSSTKGTYLKSLEIAVREGLLCNLENLYLSKALTNDPQENGTLLSTLLPPMTVHCSSLKYLCLSDNKLDVTAAKALGYAFVNFSTNKRNFDLNLCRTCLNSVTVTAFCCCSVKPKSSLQGKTYPGGYYRIDFSENPIGCNGLSTIFQMLSSKNCSVTDLRLHDLTNSKTDSLDHTVEDLQMDKMSGTSKRITLDLGGNKMFKEGMHIEYLEKGVREGAFVLLIELNLSSALSDSAALNGALLSKLLPSIALGCACLERLNLSNNMLNSPTGAQVLGQILPNLCNTKENFILNLSDCCLDTDSIKAFCEKAIAALSHTIQPQLIGTRQIDLCRNPVQCKGLVSLLHVLGCKKCPITSLNLSETINDELFNLDLYNPGTNCTNIGLTELNLCKNNFGGSKVFLLVNYMQVCKSLETLSCDNCSLSSHEIVTISEHSKKSNINLEKLQVWSLCDCTIDDEGAYVLLESTLNLFPNLEYINLSNNFVHDFVQKKLKQRVKEIADRNFIEKKKKIEEMWEEWKKTQSQPRNKEMLAEFLRMWDQLLNTLINILNTNK